MPKTNDNQNVTRVFDDKSLEYNLKKIDKKKDEDAFIEINEQIYSQMLKSYSKNIAFSNWIKLGLKVIFFFTIMKILGSVLEFFSASLNYLFSIITVENISKLSIESVLSAVTIIVPPICSLIVAFIKLPKIIAKYLFNKNEDSSMNSIITSIQLHDREVYKMMHFQETADKLLNEQNDKSADDEKEAKEKVEKQEKTQK